MIQLLPTLEATSLKMPELRYGTGFHSWAFYLSYLVPNFYNFGLNVDVHTNPGKEYLYLGAPALFGIFCLVFRRRVRDVVPALAAGLVCLTFLVNLYALVWNVIRHSALLAQIVRDWYFLAGVNAALAALAAYGLDDFLRRKARPGPNWFAWLVMALLVAWSTWSLFRWLPGGPGFEYGLRSILDPAIFLLLFALGIFVVRAEKGNRRIFITALLLLAAGIDYKVFGTSKRFNAAPSSGQTFYSPNLFQDIDSDTYTQIRAHDEYRMLLDIGGPLHLNLRHYPGLRTPQGYDPLFTTQYHDLLEGSAHFRNGFEFDIGPDKQDLLQALSVRYFITSESSPLYAQYRDSPAFRRIGTDAVYYRVFEYRDARPSYGWDSLTAGTVERVRWTPEIREFRLRSAAGGRFILHEQFSPSWQATIDGRRAIVERTGAFQALQVPAGEHRVQFRFRSVGLRAGAWVSLASALALALVLLRDENRTATGTS
jgi:hypothetical protein